MVIGRSGCVARTAAAVPCLVLDQNGAVLFDFGVVRAADRERVIRLPLAGATPVTLELDDGGNGIDSGHSVWEEASFVLPK
ncbi:MAG: NPCBM/NEW2 domain-containing protein [Thermoanaerobaculaceae bacterium]|nr:NPCBM/NEW2 domain-containing protein [Thermoanaerobaculaceae bacterium]NLH12293.1 hypothetical protein [Holophagae bacterium]HPW55338.1 hypothetical protein [Thermoanaerobaculaceae bacterium]